MFLKEIQCILHLYKIFFQYHLKLLKCIENYVFIYKNQVIKLSIGRINFLLSLIKKKTKI